jgi:hypothetical protein
MLHGRRRPKRDCQIVAMVLSLFLLLLSMYVVTVASLESLAVVPVRSAVLYPSQCRFSVKLVPDVKTVANRKDSVLRYLVT